MKNRGKTFIIMGLLLITSAFFIVAYNLYDEKNAESSATHAIEQIRESIPIKDEAEVPKYTIDPDMDMPIKTINGKDYIGTLKIPTLELELPILSEWSYPNLKIAPCRYTGSVYSKDMVIAAHNYRSHFGNLKILSEGESIVFTDMDGNIFYYEVVGVETLPPTSVDEMVTNSENWDLTLFTCTIGGQTRITIRCKLINK